MSINNSSYKKQKTKEKYIDARNAIIFGIIFILFALGAMTGLIQYEKGKMIPYK